MIYIILGIFLIMLLYFPCFHLPDAIDNNFEDKYGTKICSWGYSIANAVTIAVLCYVLFDNQGSISYLSAILIVVVIAISGISIRRCITIARECNASNTEMIKGIIAQILSTFGVASIIIILFMSLVLAESDTKSKKKKR